LAGGRLALTTFRANFRRVFCASPRTKVKNLPDNKREVTFNLLFLLSLCFLPARIDLSSTISRGFDADNPWARLADDEYMNNFPPARRRSPSKIDIP